MRISQTLRFRLVSVSARASARAAALACLLTAGIVAVGASVERPVAAADGGPDFVKQVQPILKKYCAGCHNDADREGRLSVDSHASLMKGGESGAVLTPGQGEASRMVRLLVGKGEPKMPPKGNEGPSAADIGVLKAWIDAGAKGPSGETPDPADFAVPKIKLQAPRRNSVHAVAIAASGISTGSPPASNPAVNSPAAISGGLVALARHGEVELQSLADRKTVKLFEGLRGSVNGVAFSSDGKFLAAAAGEPNLFGEVRIWKTSGDFALVRSLRGHRDSLQSVRISPDGKLVATGGYDQRIKLWEIESGREVKSLDGHNGPVFDLAFRPDGKILASVSGDRTVKLWDVATGARLDTLKESLLELYTVAFSPDGRRVAAGGVDNRIRVWEVSESAKEGSNPLLFSQFAHELPVLRITYSADGQTLVSSGEDRLIKVWNAPTMSIRQTLAAQSDWPVGLAIAPSGKQVIVGRLDGTVETLEFADRTPADAVTLTPLSEVPAAIDYGPQPAIEQLAKVAEVEPNDGPAQATPLAVPGVGVGKLLATAPGKSSDDDLFKFTAKKGEQWMIETNAARSGSLADTKLEVLDMSGRPVPRLLLRAVRDSEIEFRGMDSNQRGVRLKNWEEMLLNEYIYLSGEVIKHFQQRRGPDADSQFYPETGSRFAFFETTSRTHALGEPAYVVVPLAVGTPVPNNGLPVFTLNFENDDDSDRKFGRDSQLTFVAPADGDYLVRVSDVRGFAGEKYDYQLVVRRPQPDFSVTLGGANPTVAAGSGKVITVKADRVDNFDGPIEVEITGLPPGYRVTTPIVIQAGLYEARGVINADADAPAPTEQNMSQTKVVATAMIAGKKVSHDVNNLGAIKLAPKPKVLVQLLPDVAGQPEAAKPVAAKPAQETPTKETPAKDGPTKEGQAKEGQAKEGQAKDAPAKDGDAKDGQAKDTPANNGQGKDAQSKDAQLKEIPTQENAPKEKPLEIGEVVIVAGQRTTCRLKIERNGFNDRVQFEIENLPHGVIVDDIGLNGVLLPEGQVERTLFLSCEPWVGESTRLFHAVAKVDGDQVSLPLRLRVQPRK